MTWQCGEKQGVSNWRHVRGFYAWRYCAGVVFVCLCSGKKHKVFFLLGFSTNQLAGIGGVRRLAPRSHQIADLTRLRGSGPPSQPLPAAPVTHSINWSACRATTAETSGSAGSREASLTRGGGPTERPRPDWSARRRGRGGGAGERRGTRALSHRHKRPTQRAGAPPAVCTRCQVRVTAR